MDRQVRLHIDRDFRRNDNIHKYAMLYASKFYRLINNVMRTNDIQKIKREMPYSWYFVKGFVVYILENGQTKSALRSKSKYLYRGLEEHFKLTMSFLDKAFISTSMDKIIAKDFAKHKGNILSFIVDDLPDNIKFIIIDQNIADYLMEEEVLFLPGVINVDLKSKELKSSYVMDGELLRAVGHAGGKSTKSTKKNAKLPEFMDWALMPEIELDGKYMVFYRTAINRPVEIANFVKIPVYKDPMRMRSFFKNSIKPLEDSYEAILSLIPEYIDNLALISSKKGASEICMSYRIITAIYDPITKNVDDLDYGVPAMLRGEIGSDNRDKEIIVAIKAFFEKTM